MGRYAQARRRGGQGAVNAFAFPPPAPEVWTFEQDADSGHWGVANEVLPLEAPTDFWQMMWWEGEGEPIILDPDSVFELFITAEIHHAATLHAVVRWFQSGVGPMSDWSNKKDVEIPA